MTKYLYYINKLIVAYSALFFACSINSCSKLIEAPIPSEFVADENVYSNDASAIAVLDGMYISMNGKLQPFQGNQSIALLSGLSADELTLYSAGASGANLYNSYYINNLSQTIGITFTGAEHWGYLYNYVFRVNAAIDGLQGSKEVSPSIQKQLLGEAKLLRALYYFYLVNLFGDVPIVLSTDPEINSKIGRSPKSDVYLQIIEDLQDAEINLSSQYLNGQLLSSTQERVRPTKWAAKALLARIYLYVGDWANAEAMASELISNTGLFELRPLSEVFLKNSREAIWQLQPTAVNFNTQEAQALVIPQTGPNGNSPAFLSKMQLSSFESGDQRAFYGSWVDTTIYKVTSTKNDTVVYANKYKYNLLDTTIKSTTNMKEYFMVLRLGEQFLIRAEARAQQGKISEAQADVNEIRKRAFLTSKPIAVNDKAGLLTAILHERQVELFCEAGHRWLDLKRTGKIDDIMSVVTPIKSNGTTQWRSYQQLYPLPLVSDLQKSVVLEQNEGYN